MIYQLEDNDDNYQSIIKSYEEKYPIFALLKDKDETILYQSNLPLETDPNALLDALDKQATKELISASKPQFTMQWGTFEVSGNKNDKYLGIPATIVSKSEKTYTLTLLYQPHTTIELLKRQIPFYSFIWLGSLFAIIIISRFILKKAFQPTEQVLKSQKEFIASASHELKSPLAVILANIEIIQHMSEDESQIQHLATVADDECMRMSSLIKDLLFLASSDANSWTLNKSQTNIDTLLISLYESFNPICINNGVELHLNLSDKIYPTLQTDKDRLYQILSIYMDNAIQHSPNNDHIEVQTNLTEKKITFYVIDHGDGISDENKAYIFNRFYCVDQSHTDKSHFGLGLSIAYELSKMLNGKAGVIDTLDGGATFWVTIPLK
ncbi:MAG: HAMP domain-containing sensor histidine kinase [Lachnospiraceae bacterium]|nr:HAMP domain-containing sensor histidine kinase [Lachnospiraceae bacterium]